MAVARRLQQMGYLILARNYRAWQLGELDIVAQKNDVIFFVEIKARSNSDQWGGPAAAITARKLGNMRKSALFFAREKDLLHYKMMFLAGLVQLDKNGKIMNLDIVPIEKL